MSEKITSKYRGTETMREPQRDAVRQEHLAANCVLKCSKTNWYLFQHILLSIDQTRHTTQYLGTFRTHLPMNYTFFYIVFNLFFVLSLGSWRRWVVDELNNSCSIQSLSTYADSAQFMLRIINNYNGIRFAINLFSADDNLNSLPVIVAVMTRYFHSLNEYRPKEIEKMYNPSKMRVGSSVYHSTVSYSYLLWRWVFVMFRSDHCTKLPLSGKPSGRIYEGRHHALPFVCSSKWYQTDDFIQPGNSVAGSSDVGFDVWV